MVKFDEKGQGFWDFILENCSAKFIEEVQGALDLSSDSKILDVVVEKTNYETIGPTVTTVVYIVFGDINHSLEVHTERRYSDGKIILDEAFMPYHMLNHFKKLGVI